MAVAIGFSMVALAVYALTGTSGFEAAHTTLLGTIAAYGVGGLCIGAIGGALRPVMQSTAGFALGSAFLGALAYAVFQIAETGPRTWQPFDWAMAAVFAGMGVATGFLARSRLRARARARDGQDG